MVKMPHFETSCLETGVKTLVTETGQQLPPSYIFLGYHLVQILSATFIANDLEKNCKSVILKAPQQKGLFCIMVFGNFYGLTIQPHF